MKTFDLHGHCFGTNFFFNARKSGTQSLVTKFIMQNAVPSVTLYAGSLHLWSLPTSHLPNMQVQVKLSQQFIG